jgi:uncharacterized protein
VEFFERAVELQERYRRPGMKISNALQTNGTKLDTAWCRFLGANDFLVGISIDGPRRLHDRYRKTKGGKGSFDDVKRGLDHLIEADVEFNVLTVVQRHNGDHPLEVYEGLKALGAHVLQFIPIVEPTGGGKVSPRTVLPEQFGSFLIEIFEKWRAGDIGRVHVQHFETALNAVMGNQNTLCVHSPTCGRAVAVEHNGDLFACDHFVFDEYRLGNITAESYHELLDGPAQTAFGADKLKKLPPKCVGCQVRYMCNGGCPAHWFVPTANSPFDTNYLCKGYLMFFRHIEPTLHGMKAALNQRMPASEYFRFMKDSKHKPGRNDPCPCGSGRKFKQCCGA